jgi:four helix bundle protein
MASADIDDRPIDVERLDVYRASLEFHAFVNALRFGRGDRELRDQLRRASISITLNIAEAVGRRGLPDRARFIAIARGSASECAAILDILRVCRLAPHSETKRGRSLLVRIISMLTRWGQWLDARTHSEA